MPTASFFDNLPPELAGAAEAQKRRQAVADALLQQAQAPLAPPQQTGVYAIRQSPLSLLTKVVQAVGARRAQQDADQQRNDLAQQYNDSLKQAVRTYIDTKTGTPGQAPLTPNDDEGNVNPPIGAVPGKPIEAAVGAAASPFPQLQALGQADLKNIGHNTLDTKEILSLSDFSPTSKVAVAQLVASGMSPQAAISALRGKADIKGNDGYYADFSQVGEGQGPKAVGYVGPRFEQTLVPGADGKPDLYQRDPINNKLTKLDNAPKVTVNANSSYVNAGQKAGAEALFKNAANTVNDLGEQARAAQASRDSIARMQALDQQGVFSGQTSGGKTFISNLSQSLGLPISAKQAATLGNTETYNAVATDAAQRLISQFGGNKGVTAAEAEQIKKIVPQTQNSPQARQQLYGIINNLAARQISNFKAANQAFTQAVTADNPAIWANHFDTVFGGQGPATQPPVAPSPTAPAPKPVGQLKPYNGQ